MANNKKCFVIDMLWATGDYDGIEIPWDLDEGDTKVISYLRLVLRTPEGDYHLLEIVLVEDDTGTPSIRFSLSFLDDLPQDVNNPGNARYILNQMPAKEDFELKVIDTEENKVVIVAKGHDSDGNWDGYLELLETLLF